MKFITFLLFIAFSLIFSFGCESQNPICGDTLCVDGSVFLKSELPAGAEYDSVNVDESVILATLVGTPVPVDRETIPTTDDPVALADIITDVASGNRTYVGKIVSVIASVESDTSTFDNNDAITLQTNNDDVWFFVLSRNAPGKLQGYRKGQSYTFNVLILRISPPDPPSLPQYAVWSYLPSDPVSITMNTLVTDVMTGRTTYLEKIVSIRATVEFGTQTYFDEDDDYETISLITNNENVILFLNNEHYPPSVLGKYQENSTYDFNLFIYRISDSAFSDKKYISAALVLD